MKALVTGAGGFVGANLVRHLLRAGQEPVAVVRPGSVPWRLQDLDGEVAVRATDLRDADALHRSVLEARPDVIFHLAAHGAYSWQQDFDAMLAVNVRAIESLLLGAREVGARLVNAGSSSEYGRKDHAPTEAELVEPNSLYAVTKVAATQLCRLAAATHGQQAITLRLYSVYGPWEEPGRLMPTLVERGLAGRLPPLVDPEIARDFVWVKDACDAFLAAASADLDDPGSVLNVASGTQTTLRSLVELARALFQIEAEPAWGTMERRGWDTAVWVGQPAAAAAALDWRASTPLDHGLRLLAEWLQAGPQVAARYAPESDRVGAS
jgi:nucleoside-diphosphate-sugar epimerase